MLIFPKDILDAINSNEVDLSSLAGFVYVLAGSGYVSVFDCQLCNLSGLGEPDTNVHYQCLIQAMIKLVEAHLEKA